VRSKVTFLAVCLFVSMSALAGNPSQSVGPPIGNPPSVRPSPVGGLRAPFHPSSPPSALKTVEGFRASARIRNVSQSPLSGVNVKNLPNPCSLAHPPGYCSRH